MTWKTGTIKLDAAKAIFEGITFTEMVVGGKVVGYEADRDGSRLEDTSLTSLCRRLWQER